MNLRKYAEILRYLDEAADAEGTPAGGAEADAGTADGDAGAADGDAGTEADGDAGTADGDGDGQDNTGDGDGDGDAGDGDTGDGEGESEGYADFTLPEGMEINAARLDKFAPIMKELGLDQAQAQTLVDAEVERVQAQQEEAANAFTQQKQDWFDAAESDKEYGGDKFEQSSKLAGQAIDKFGTPELKKLMDDYGVGNHPEMVRFMYRVGKATQEDNPGQGGDHQQEQGDRASILYPK